MNCPRLLGGVGAAVKCTIVVHFASTVMQWLAVARNEHKFRVIDTKLPTSLRTLYELPKTGRVGVGMGIARRPMHLIPKRLAVIG